LARRQRHLRVYLVAFGLLLATGRLFELTSRLARFTGLAI